MDKGRIIGAIKTMVGNVKVAVGKAAGDPKIVADGKVERVAGKVQNAVGRSKDALRNFAKGK